MARVIPSPSQLECPGDRRKLPKMVLMHCEARKYPICRNVTPTGVEWMPLELYKQDLRLSELV